MNGSLNTSKKKDGNVAIAEATETEQQPQPPIIGEKEKGKICPFCEECFTEKAFSRHFGHCSTLWFKFMEPLEWIFPGKDAWDKFRKKHARP